VFDLLVRGGTVVDGRGGEPSLADVGVSDGRIAAVGQLPDAPAAAEIDATGRYVLPGLIDTHAHADLSLTRSDQQLAALRQGVTTVICGQDGLSYAPAAPAALAYVNRYFAAINGVWPQDGPLSVAELLASWHHRGALNAAYLVPHGTVRFTVLGDSPAAPDPDQAARMLALVEQALSEGAVGLSTGLEYRPGGHARPDEIAALCRPVGAAGLPYVTHMRGYGVNAPAGLAEAARIAETAGVGLHVSHYHGPGELLLSLWDALSVESSFDSYPYLRGCTILSMLALPGWSVSDLVERRPAALAALDPDLWPRLTLAHVPAPEWAWAEGLSLPEVARRTGGGAGEALIDILVATDLVASAVVTAPATTTDDGMRLLARQPAHMGGSDGIVIGGHPHPRAWGAFARFLGRHVRELGDWSWPQAAQHLAARAAARFGLTDRGNVSPGKAADLAIVDPLTVRDVATFAEPRALAVGVADVIVNGVVVLRNGELTGALAGRALTPYPGGAV
jgi:N-acyl-D-amino-acid deacylase